MLCAALLRPWPAGSDWSRHSSALAAAWLRHSELLYHHAADVHTSTPEPFWRFGSGLLSTSVHSHQQQAAKCAHRTCSHVCENQPTCRRKPVLHTWSTVSPSWWCLTISTSTPEAVKSPRVFNEALVTECNSLFAFSSVTTPPTRSAARSSSSSGSNPF